MMSEKRRRMPIKLKQELVLRIFRGETLWILSGELDIPAERLTKWKEAFTQGGIENLKIKPNSPEIIENKMLKEMVGEKSMKIALLYQKIDKLEAGLLPKSKKAKKHRK